MLSFAMRQLGERSRRPMSTNKTAGTDADAITRAIAGDSERGPPIASDIKPAMSGASPVPARLPRTVTIAMTVARAPAGARNITVENPGARYKVAKKAKHIRATTVTV